MPRARSTTRAVTERAVPQPVRRHRRWISILLACEFAVAAALPFDARDRGTDSAQVVGDRAVHLRSLGRPAADRLLARISSNIGAAVEKVEAFWGVDWPRDISVVAAGSDEQFRAAAGGGGPAQWADIAVVTVADRIDSAHRLVLGQRIVFAPGTAGMSDSAPRIVLTHELFHYASRADTALDTPRWLAEGVADFVARPRRRRPTRA